MTAIESNAAAEATTAHPIRLNIGGGDKHPIDGFTVIDRKFGQEAYPLDYPDNSVEEIRASHVLEHFGFAEADKVLSEWVRVLRPGGRIRIAVPDIARICHAVATGEAQPSVLHVIYGGQTDSNDFHKNGWDRNGLTVTMRSCGLTAIEPWESDAADCSSHPYSLNLQGIKPAPVKRNVVALMSTPRLIMKHNYLCVIETVMKKNMHLKDFGGAYWHQGMERMIREAWDEYDWLLCIDYDTVFSPATLDRLAIIFEQNQEYDALAPLQMRRENQGPLAQCDATGEDLCKDVVPARSAHFGFTLLRAESCKKFAAWCKERGEPMMLEKCTPDCDWGDARIDADINFWLRWNQAGLKLGITPWVSVGHLEELVVWPREDLTAMYQPMNEYSKFGAPIGARR